MGPYRRSQSANRATLTSALMRAASGVWWGSSNRECLSRVTSSCRSSLRKRKVCVRYDWYASRKVPKETCLPESNSPHQKIEPSTSPMRSISSALSPLVACIQPLERDILTVTRLTFQISFCISAEISCTRSLSSSDSCFILVARLVTAVMITLVRKLCFSVVSAIDFVSFKIDFNKSLSSCTCMVTLLMEF